MRVRFRECVLDSETRELLVGGRTVHLTPKAFELLAILIEARPRALSKAEIHEKLWPSTFVSEGTLTSLLAEVRSAIGDEKHDNRLIRTVHRFGYAFAGPVEIEGAGPESARARLSRPGSTGAPELGLEEGENVLGRDPSRGHLPRRHERVAPARSHRGLRRRGPCRGSPQQERDVRARGLDRGAFPHRGWRRDPARFRSADVSGLSPCRDRPKQREGSRP